MDITYWSVRSSSRREGDGVKALCPLLNPCKRHSFFYTLLLYYSLLFILAIFTLNNLILEWYLMKFFNSGLTTTQKRQQTPVHRTRITTLTAATAFQPPAAQPLLTTTITECPTFPNRIMTFRTPKTVLIPGRIRVGGTAVGLAAWRRPRIR